jgi:hypothetical protein
MRVRGGVVEMFGVAEERARKTARRRGRQHCDQGRRGAGEFLFRTCKERGEWAELCFMARARQMGMTVLKPYGDSSTYDVGIEVGGRLVRVQTKSTTFRRGERIRAISRGREGGRIGRGPWIILRCI